MAKRDKSKNAKSRQAKPGPPGRSGPARPSESPAGRFPKGIEGTRGEKDSADRARRFFREQRSYPFTESEPSEGATATAHEPSSGSPSEPVGRAGALGGTYDEAEQRLTQQLPHGLAAPAAEGAAAAAADAEAQAVGGISISGVRTAGQAGTQSVFLLNTDALALVIDISATAAFVGSGRLFDANFQIIEFSTNNVKVNQPSNNVGFSFGQFFWISRGNNWGPNPSDYTTPAKWGLSAGLYMFRATVAVQGIQDFAVSSETVFRVR